MTALADYELERNGDLVWHPGRDAADGIGLYYEDPVEPTKKTPGRPAHVRLTGPLGGARHLGPAELRSAARRLTDAADTLEARIRPELHPDRRADVGISTPELEEISLRPAVYYYAVRLILSIGLEDAQTVLASRRSKLTPEQETYVLSKIEEARS